MREKWTDGNWLSGNLPMVDIVMVRGYIVSKLEGEDPYNSKLDV